MPHLVAESCQLVKDAFRCDYAGEHTVRNRVQPVKSGWVV